MGMAEMFQVLAPMMFVLPIMVWFLVIGPFILYPLARWKTHREPYPDPQLGLKVALHYFRMIAFQLLLLGALIVLWTVIRKTSDSRGDFYRAGFGLLVPAALVYGGHVMLLMRTNEHAHGTVRRLFLGYNLLLTGLLGLVALVLAFQALFAKGSSGDEGRLFFAGLVVYVGAWVGCGWQFMTLVGADLGGAASGPPQSMMPPPPQSAAGGAPGLPPLGGGFPPVNQ
jgi:hypothetical protein